SALKLASNDCRLKLIHFTEPAGAAYAKTRARALLSVSVHSLPSTPQAADRRKPLSWLVGAMSVMNGSLWLPSGLPGLDEVITRTNDVRRQFSDCEDFWTAQTPSFDPIARQIWRRTSAGDWST